MKDDAGWEDYIKQYSKKRWPKELEIEKEFTQALIRWNPLEKLCNTRVNN